MARKPGGDEDPFDTPEKAYAEAERRIAAAEASNATELVLQLLQLERLPPSIAGLTGLQALSFGGSPVADLAALAGLSALDTLLLGRTRVADLAPIAGLSALGRLWLDRTQVADLAPLAGLTALERLSLTGTPVADLAPLAGLAALRRLLLDGTPVADFAPLARMTRLVDHVHEVWTNDDRKFERRIAGLAYANTPIAAMPPFDRLSKLEQPARTIETINEVRRQQGLPPHVPGEAPPPPEVEDIPAQTKTALVFGGDPGKPIEISGAGDAPVDTPAQRNFYDEVKQKSSGLVTSCGHSNRLGGLRTTADKLASAMGNELLDLNLALFWSRMNTLRAAHEADRRARAVADPDSPPLPEETSECLRDLVATLNVFASGEHRLVEMDRLSLDPAVRIATDELLDAARSLAASAKHAPAVVQAAAAEALDEALPLPGAEGPSAERAKEFGTRSARNLSLEAIRRAFAGIPEPVRKAAGKTADGVKWTYRKAHAIAGFATTAGGVYATVQYIVANEPAIRALIRELPAQSTLNWIIDFIIRQAS